MTTYTVTITRDGSSQTHLEMSAATVKTLKKNNPSATIKSVKNATPKFWYYRNVQVYVHEELQNGHTLASAVDGSFGMRHCNTSELEYK